MCAGLDVDLSYADERSLSREYYPRARGVRGKSLASVRDECVERHRISNAVPVLPIFSIKSIVIIKSTSTARYQPLPGQPAGSHIQAAILNVPVPSRGVTSVCRSSRLVRSKILRGLPGERGLRFAANYHVSPVLEAADGY